MRTKQLQPLELIVQSLENLKKELSMHSEPICQEIWFKINSCLYSEYPHKKHLKEFQS
jgi:hypothetical protein